MPSSVEKFPDTAYFKMADSSSVEMCGGYSFSNNQQIEQVIIHLYKHGALGGSERLRPIIYLDRAMTKTYATGDWFNLSSVEGLSTYWRGRIGLTFTSSPWVETGKTYYLGIETDSYTRSGMTAYLAYLLDGPEPINDITSYAIAAEFYGKRSKDTAEV